MRGLLSHICIFGFSQDLQLKCGIQFHAFLFNYISYGAEGKTVLAYEEKSIQCRFMFFNNLNGSFV